MGSNTSRVDEPPSKQEQSVVYTTPDSSGTCTLRAQAGEKGAIITVKDYTFDKEGTRVNITVGPVGRLLQYNGVSLGFFDKHKQYKFPDRFGLVKIKHWGNTLQVREKQNQQFCIAYGVPRDRCGFLIVTKDHTDQHHDTLSVRHLYGTAKQGFSIVVVQVWYDIRKGSYVCTLTGPSRHSWPSDVEAILAKGKAAYPSDVEHSTGTITGLINNRWGHVFGDLNGSLINFITQIFLDDNGSDGGHIKNTKIPSKPSLAL